MSRMWSTLSGLAREPDARSSQQPSLPLPVQNGVHGCNNAENIVPSRESQLMHSRAREFGNSHHGLRENRISGQLEKKPSILLARWRCPPEIILDRNWRVAAGEQSEEVKVQAQREARLKQSIYPHPSAIPPSPPVSPDPEEGHLDDENIPIIPLEPVYIDSFSDEETPSSTNGVSNNMASASSSNPPTGANDPAAALTGSYADVGAAASAAFTALMKSYEQGNLIDTELLIGLLNNPKMIQLLNNIRPQANSDSTQPSPNTPSCVATNPVRENLVDIELLMKLLSDPKMVELLKNAGLLTNPDSTRPPLNAPSRVTTNPVNMSSNGLPASASDMASPSVPLSRPMRRESFQVPKPPASSTAIFARPPLTYPQRPASTYSESTSSVRAPPPVKDVSYLKSLIRKHGVERPEVEGPRSTLKTSSSSSPSSSSYPLTIRESHNQMRLPKGQGNMKPLAYKKPCMYFGTPRGCRLGLGCPFRHELPHPQLYSGGVSGASGSKRIKLTRHSGNGY